VRGRHRQRRQSDQRERPGQRDVLRQPRHPAGDRRADQPAGPDGREEVAVAVQAEACLPGDHDQQHRLHPVDQAAEDVRAHEADGRRVGPQRRSLITTVNTTATPKVSALTTNAIAGEPISSTPPSAGPAITPVAVTADLAAFAPGRSLSRTSLGVTAEMHGR
jgi:hypothetical protein